MIICLLKRCEDCRPQPDWFKKSALSLQPLISLRNSLLKRWLHSQCHRDRQRHFVMRRTVASAVKTAKNDWFQQKAREVEDNVMRDVGAWKGVLGTFKEGELVC